MDSISKRFAATHALRHVSFQARSGRVLALIGENGAGKSTLMKVLAGAIPPDHGTMRLAGAKYAPRGPQDARAAGVAMIYQELNLAPDLSVADNVTLGNEPNRAGFLDRERQGRQVRAALQRLGLNELDIHRPTRSLSIAKQQLVEIARALVLNARVIVFDEPTSSLTKHDTEQLFKIIKQLREAGLAIIYISHFLEEVREVADDYTVLRDGQAMGRGQLADITDDQLVTLMVGRNVDELFPSVAHTVGEPILSVHNLSGIATPTMVDLTLHRGEILGIAGLVGAGRTELLRSIFGLDAVQSGEIRVHSNLLTGSARHSIRRGLGYVSEDRKSEGLAQSRSIADNVTLSRLKPYSNMGWLSLRRRHQAVQQSMAQLEIKAQSVDQPVEALSGGNQQKVALARVMHQDAEILLLDEPTRGIDVGTKSEIYRLIGEQAAAGKAILFVSSYLPELLAICDRVAIMSRGRLLEVRNATEWTAESALAVAISSEDQAETSPLPTDSQSS